MSSVAVAPCRTRPLRAASALLFGKRSGGVWVAGIQRLTVLTPTGDRGLAMAPDALLRRGGRARSRWWMSGHQAPHGWGASMSRSGETSVSVVKVRDDGGGSTPKASRGRSSSGAGGRSVGSRPGPARVRARPSPDGVVGAVADGPRGHRRVDDQGSPDGQLVQRLDEAQDEECGAGGCPSAAINPRPERRLRSADRADRLALQAGPDPQAQATCRSPALPARSANSSAAVRRLGSNHSGVSAGRGISEVCTTPDRGPRSVALSPRISP